MLCVYIYIYTHVCSPGLPPGELRQMEGLPDDDTVFGRPINNTINDNNNNNNSNIKHIDNDIHININIYINVDTNDTSNSMQTCLMIPYMSLRLRPLV